MIIIVKKHTASPTFKPHFNRELGKKYYTAKEYYSDMKAKGLEPYNPSKITRPEPKPYKQSAWAKAMLQDIKDRKGRPPGDRFISELAKRGHTKERAEQARKIANGK